MNRADYLALFGRIATQGVDHRVHWLTGPGAGTTSTWDSDPSTLPGTPIHGLGGDVRQDEGGQQFYAESLMGQPRLVVVGGGHVGQAFVAIGVTLGFQVIVIDERPEFAQPSRFPGADQVLCGDYATTLTALPEYANTYYVLVTPGHRMDRESASVCLRKPHEYVGMIGSRGKVATVNKALAADGFTDAEIADLHAPIGLDIGGREPAEIAVSIAAEVIQVRSSKARRAFDPVVGRAIRDLAPGDKAVLATIVGHGGSVPRGAGSRMLITPEALIGSVGGGAIEAATIVRARELLGTDETPDAPATDLRDYDLSAREGAELGMICGGRVRVLFERL